MTALIELLLGGDEFGSSSPPSSGGCTSLATLVQNNFSDGVYPEEYWGTYDGFEAENKLWLVDLSSRVDASLTSGCLNTGEYIYLKLLPYISDGSSFGSSTFFYLYDNTDNIGYIDSSMYFGIGVYVVGASGNQITGDEELDSPYIAYQAWDGDSIYAPDAAVPYDSEQHSWLRIRRSGSSLEVGTAPDSGNAPGSWTMQWDAPPAVSGLATGAALSLAIDHYNSDGTAGWTRVAAINISAAGPPASGLSFSSLVDNFNGSSLDTSIWTVVSDETSTAVSTQADGVLNVTWSAPEVSANTAFGGVISDYIYRFNTPSDAGVFVEVDRVPQDSGNSGLNVELGDVRDGGSYGQIDFTVNQTGLDDQAYLSVFATDTGPDDSTFESFDDTIPFTDARWLRIRRTDDTFIVFETAPVEPDGAAPDPDSDTWTERFRCRIPQWFLQNGTSAVFLDGFNSNSDTYVSGHVTFDNLNFTSPPVTSPPVTSPPDMPSISGIHDNFDLGIIDSTIWDTGDVSNHAYSNVSDQLSLDGTSSLLKSYAAWSLPDGATVYVRAWPDLTSGADSFFGIASAGGASSYLEFRYNGGDLAMNSGSPSETSSITYSSVAHAWWRIRRSGDQVAFDTAPTAGTQINPGTWTQRWITTLSPDFLSEQDFYVYAGAGS